MTRIVHRGRIQKKGLLDARARAAAAHTPGDYCELGAAVKICSYWPYVRGCIAYVVFTKVNKRKTYFTFACCSTDCVE